MHRIAILVLAALLAAPPVVVAGEKCIQREPEPIFVEGELDVHSDGEWHDDTGPTGNLSQAAMDRFRAYKRSGASKRKVKRCLQALIKNEKSRTAKRLCKVRKRQVF